MIKSKGLIAKIYPCNKNIKSQLAFSILFGLWVFLFLLVSDAFELYQLSITEKVKRLSFYGIASSFSYFVALGYQIDKSRKEAGWSIKDELTFLTISVLSAAFLIYGVFWFYGNENSNTLKFPNFLLLVYSPSLLITVPFLSVGRYIIGLKRSGKKRVEKIIISGTNNESSIELDFNELMYLRSAGNYVEVHSRKNSELQKSVVRRKFQDIEKEFPQLFRTHRSYLINPAHFRRFTRDKKNLFIDLGFDIKIPVARGRVEIARSTFPLETNQ